MDFAEAHKDWTVGDWKELLGQMRPKSIIWNHMGEEMGVENARRGIE